MAVASYGLRRLFFKKSNGQLVMIRLVYTFADDNNVYLDLSTSKREPHAWCKDADIPKLIHAAWALNCVTCPRNYAIEVRGPALITSSVINTLSEFFSELGIDAKDYTFTHESPYSLYFRNNGNVYHIENYTQLIKRAIIFCSSMFNESVIGVIEGSSGLRTRTSSKERAF